MSSRWSRHISFAQAALLLSLFLSMSACSGRTEEPANHSEPTAISETIVFETDTSEWHVCLFAQHLIYSKAVEVQLPSPWMLPTREDATILKTCTYGDGSERFVTSDGYTFGMPSASVSKAGQKTQYSVLGLWKRKTVIVIDF